MLVTGGTGTFGAAFVRHALHCGAARVVIFSRDEYKQDNLRRQFGPEPRVRYFLGDVRDLSRLTLALRGVQDVVHAAALKQVPALEYNPTEAVRTNILGSLNVLLAALGVAGVERVVALSTDKAVQPRNLYGATKLVMEKVLTAGNAYRGERPFPAVAVVRYGNVTGSRGSVIPRWREEAAQGGPVTITDPDATRFWITVPEACRFVEHVFATMRGGEVFVPALPAYRVADLAAAVAPGVAQATVGLRPGEKAHELLLDGSGEGCTVRPIPPETAYEVPVPYQSDRARRMSVDELRARLADLERAA